MDATTCPSTTPDAPGVRWQQTSIAIYNILKKLIVAHVSPNLGLLDIPNGLIKLVIQLKQCLCFSSMDLPPSDRLGPKTCFGSETYEIHVMQLRFYAMTSDPAVLQVN